MKLSARELESILTARGRITLGAKKRRGPQGIRPRKFVEYDTLIIWNRTAVITLPLMLVTLANQREHWRARNARAGSHRAAARAAVVSAAKSLSWWPSRETTGVRVTVVRLGPRRIDPHTIGDGVAKNVVDGVADAIAFGNEIQRIVLGVRVGTGRYSDDDARIEWVFGQEHPSPYGCRVRIEPREKA